MELAGKTVGFIGAGAMAESIVFGLLKSNTLESSLIIVSDTDQGRLKYFKDKFSVKGLDNSSLVERADIVVLAVKPKVLPQALTVVAGNFRGDQLLVSIAAGISTSRIEELIGRDVPVVRVMPNTPSLVNAGASALCAGSCASAEHLDTAREIFESVGKTVLVPEYLMDAVTGLSGSGPAYIFLVIESLTDGAVRIGLPVDIARVLAAQTVLGAAQLVLESGEHPAILREKVTTPGGTTAAGLYALEKGGIRRAFMEAVAEAAQRSRELDEIK